MVGNPFLAAPWQGPLDLGFWEATPGLQHLGGGPWLQTLGGSPLTTATREQHLNVGLLGIANLAFQLAATIHQGQLLDSGPLVRSFRHCPLAGTPISNGLLLRAPQRAPHDLETPVNPHRPQRLGGELSTGAPQTAPLAHSPRCLTPGDSPLGPDRASLPRRWLTGS